MSAGPVHLRDVCSVLVDTFLIIKNVHPVYKLILSVPLAPLLLIVRSAFLHIFLKMVRVHCAPNSILYVLTVSKLINARYVLPMLTIPKSFRRT